MGFADYAQRAANFESALEIARSARTCSGTSRPRASASIACARCLGEYAAALHSMRQTIRSLERLKLTRYQVMAYELLASLLLDLDLNRQAVEHAERGLALAREPRRSRSGACAARRAMRSRACGSAISTWVRR